MDQRLNVRVKTIKLFEENKSVNLHNLSLGSIYNTQLQTAKEKTDELSLIKIKNLCYKRHCQESEKNNTTMGKNTCKSSS